MWCTTCLCGLYQDTGLGTATKTETQSSYDSSLNLCHHSFRNVNQCISGILRIHLVESISIHFVIDTSVFNFNFDSIRNEELSSLLCYPAPLWNPAQVLFGPLDASCWRSAPTIKVINILSRLEWCWWFPKVVCCSVVNIIWLVHNYATFLCLYTGTHVLVIHRNSSAP